MDGLGRSIGGPAPELPPFAPTGPPPTAPPPGLGPAPATTPLPYGHQPSPSSHQGQPGQSTPKQKGVWSKKKTFGFFAILMLGVVGLLGVGVIAITAEELSETANNVSPFANIGDCFNRDGTKRAVSCDTSHHFVVFSVVEYDPGTSYPTGFEKSRGNQLCNEDFQLVTGESIYTSDYSYHEVYPSESSWNGGNRVVVCALFHHTLRPIEADFGY